MSKPVEEETPKLPERVDDPGLLEKAFNRSTQTGPGAMSSGEVIPRRRISFDIDGSDCAPKQFTNEAGEYVTFRMTLSTLMSGEEISATKGILDPAEAGLTMAKSTIEKINGAPCVGDQLDWTWEALGPKGRQLVITMYAQIGALDPVGMGKASASSTIE